MALQEFNKIIIMMMMMIILMIVKGRENYSLQVSNTFLKITTPNQNQGPKKVLSGHPHK